MFFDGSMDYMGSQLPMPSLTGDFYQESDVVTRGLSLYSGASDFSQVQDFLHYGDACGLFEKGDIETVGRGPANEPRGHLSTSRFQEGDEPLQVPQDEFFQLEPTAVAVNEASAAQIGNCVLDFLGSEAMCLITKVNTTKFTIKAEICLDGLSCETKVRVYRQAFGQYVVEMQRRSGDAIAFNRLYQLASQHMDAWTHSRGSGVSSTGAEDIDVQPRTAYVSDQVQPSVVYGDADSSMAPLLDLACVDNRTLQAEAAQAMAQAAAKDANLAMQLCASKAFAVLQSLLPQLYFSIAEPMARLLVCLCLLPEAKGNFIDEELLRLMIGKVWASSTGQFASEQLAQAICHTITQHVAQLAPEGNQQLTAALSEKLREKPSEFAVDVLSPQDRSTCHYLQESMQMLRLFCPLPACY